MGKNLWVLGLRDNDTKEFKVVVAKTRDEDIIKTFI